MVVMMFLLLCLLKIIESFLSFSGHIYVNVNCNRWRQMVNVYVWPGPRTCDVPVNMLHERRTVCDRGAGFSALFCMRMRGWQTHPRRAKLLRIALQYRRVIVTASPERT